MQSQAEAAKIYQDYVSAGDLEAARGARAVLVAGLSDKARHALAFVELEHVVDRTVSSKRLAQELGISMNYANLILSRLAHMGLVQVVDKKVKGTVWWYEYDLPTEEN